MKWNSKAKAHIFADGVYSLESFVNGRKPAAGENFVCSSALLYVTFSALLEEEEMGPITSS